MRKLFFGVLLTAAAAICVSAAQPLAVFIQDARVFPASGPDLPKASVLLRDGLIADVGPNLSPPADAWIINGNGLTVYPGFIDGLSTWGIAAAAAPAAGRGNQESAAAATQPPAAPRAHGPEDRPQTYAFERAADLVSLHDNRLDAARAAGFTSAATFPNRGIVEGLGAMIDFAGERDRNMVVAQPIGQQIVLRSGSFRAGFPNSLMGDLSYVRQLYLDLDQYKQAQQIYLQQVQGTPRPEYDHNLEGLAQSPRLLLPADEYQQIDRMLAFGHEMNAPFALYGLHEAFRRVDVLKQAHVPLLVSLKWPVKPKNSDPKAIPEYRDLEMRDQAPKVPGLLQKAGIKFAFFSDGLATAPELKAAVKKAIDGGLPTDDAVRALTLNVAEMYGLADRMGSIDKGKIANVGMAKGDIFDEKSTIEYVFIDGQEFQPTEEMQRPKLAGGKPTEDDQEARQ